MEIDRKQVFNLWDTNGRRHDVINAIVIYLNILHDLEKDYPGETWGSYPYSTKQYLFYKAAIKASPEVFQSHDKFDDFEWYLSGIYDKFLSKHLQVAGDLKVDLDKNIEQRARHYTSNLVKLGFADDDRTISSVGRNLICGSLKRDVLEALLPISDVNLILFRQLLKLRIYTKPDSYGIRYFYSPCFMALYLLLNHESVDINSFKQQVQGISPYWHDRINLDEEIDMLELIISDIEIPEAFSHKEKISLAVFGNYIKNRKTSSVVSVYYTFYSALYDYVQNPDNEKYVVLCNILLGQDATKIRKAFGFGGDVLKCGNRSKVYSHKEFIEENTGNKLLTGDINSELYKNYVASKYLDTAREYSDTTIRMLGASALFQFSKPLVELSYRGLFQIFLSHLDLKHYVMGRVSQQEYNYYELGLNSRFYRELSLTDILGLDASQINDVLAALSMNFGEMTDIHSVLVQENRRKLEQHIEAKYPKIKIIELLHLISNRQNDKKIKLEVNEEATVPTIYEYLVAIAWYYISEKKISVYDSLNLTLNGDFEPVIHAGGGAGDIVVNYDDKTVMLEATLMNAAAQKRGEWEPVLRHAINLTADIYPKRVYTLFVADTLDYNTINIWRAVAAVTLKSSSTGEKTDHVVIMPFTNEHLCGFMEKNINDEKIIAAIEQSYNEVKSNFDDSWHEKIIKNL